MLGTFGNGVMICMMKQCTDHTVFFVVVVGLKQREGAALLVVVEAILHFI